MGKLFVQVERVEDLIHREDNYFTQPKQKPKPITNADRIRAMTGEELAEWLSCNCTGDGYGNSAEDWLDWLKEEAK